MLSSCMVVFAFGGDQKQMTSLKILIEQHDGFVAYPLGVKGVVVGEGDTYEEALTNVRSAIAFQVETFGVEVLQPVP